MTNEQKQALMAINKAAQTSTEVTSNSVTTTEEPVQAVPNEAPKEVVQPPKVETPKEEVKPWDAEDEPVQQATSTPLDYSKLGSALELGEVKTEQEFLTKVQEIRTKAKQLEEKPLEGIPEEFREVLEVAKTGDWKDYLASQLVDYSKFDPLIEFENDFLKKAQNNPKFFTDGKFDPTKAEDALDTIPETVREFHGQQILQAKTAQQAQIKQAQKAKAEAKREQAQKALANASKNIQELLPFENYGIKFDNKHSSQIYEGISNSSLTKKHLGVSYDVLVQSGFDMKAVARTIAASEYAEKMVKYKSDATRVQAKKEILDTAQNVQLNTPGSIVQPESQTKTKSTAEKLADYMNAQKQQGRL